MQEQKEQQMSAKRALNICSTIGAFRFNYMIENEHATSRKKIVEAIQQAFQNLKVSHLEYMGFEFQKTTTGLMWRQGDSEWESVQDNCPLMLFVFCCMIKDSDWSKLFNL